MTNAWKKLSPLFLFLAQSSFADGFHCFTSDGKYRIEFEDFRSPEKGVRSPESLKILQIAQRQVSLPTDLSRYKREGGLPVMEFNARNKTLARDKNFGLSEEELAAMEDSTVQELSAAAGDILNPKFYKATVDLRVPQISKTGIETFARYPISSIRDIQFMVDHKFSAPVPNNTEVEGALFLSFRGSDREDYISLRCLRTLQHPNLCRAELDPQRLLGRK